MTPKRITKESAAWRAVAVRLDDRSRYQEGICMTLGGMFQLDEVIDDAMRVAMSARLFSLRDFALEEAQGHADFIAPCGDTGPRILAALLMARMAKEDGK